MAATMVEPRARSILETVPEAATVLTPVHHLRVVVPVVEAAAAVALRLDVSNLKDQLKSKRTLTIWPWAIQGIIYPFL